jgi:glutaredoxin-related protein
MGEIKLYGFAACPECPPAKSFLEENGLPYRYIDVKADESAMKEWLTLRSRLKEMDFKDKVGVPAFVIGGEIIIGLDKARILKAYKVLN